MIFKNILLNIMQCQATTKAGTQCSRKALPDQQYCTQHLKIKEKQKPAEPKFETKLEPIKESESETKLESQPQTKETKPEQSSIVEDYKNLTDLFINNARNLKALQKLEIEHKFESEDLDNISDFVGNMEELYQMMTTEIKKIGKLIKKGKDGTLVTKILEELRENTEFQEMYISFLSEVRNLPKSEIRVEKPEMELINNKVFMEYWRQYYANILYESKIKKQYYQEINLVQAFFKTCGYKNIKSIESKETQEIKTQFYNDLKLTHYVCDIHNYLDIDLINRVHQWITGLKELVINRETYVFDAEITGIQSVFAIKVVHDVDYKDENYTLYHECATGLLCTNNYRKVIPNYAYIFGNFDCNVPTVNDKGAYEYCQNFDLPVYYVLYEFIPGNTFFAGIDKMTSEEFVLNFLTIVYALDYGNKHRGFTHYDLHQSNVILRNPFDKVIASPIMIDDQKKYVLNKYIPTIIDYGYSHYEKNGQNFGNYNGLDKFGVDPQKTYPLFDTYKLLMFMASACKKKKLDKLYESCKVLTMFFTNDKLDDLLKAQFVAGEYYYNLPPFEWILKLSNADFGRFVQEKFDFSKSIVNKENIPPEIPILEMDGHLLKI